MPSQLSVFASDELTMRFKQPFLTQGLNEKMAVNTPPGCYRGFRLGPNGSNNTITVIADTGNTDHVAVYQTTEGRSITLRKTGGDISINLSFLVDGAVEKTWVIAIFAQYTIGSVSAAEIRAYELDPVDEFTIAAEVDELVVLGEVVIPAASASPLPAANITLNKRTYAWKKQAPEAVDWYPIIRNGGFEFSWDDSLGDFIHSSAYWRREQISGDGQWETDQSDPRTGNKALAWEHSTTSSSATATQMVNLPVEAGQALRYKFFKKTLKTSTGGTASLEFDWRNTVGGAVAATSFNIDLSGVDGSYVEVEGTVLVPAGVGYLRSVLFRNLAVDFGSAGVAYLIDDVNVWIEGQGERHLYGEQRIGTLESTGLVLHRPDDPTDFLSASGAVIEYDINEGMISQSVGAVKIVSPLADQSAAIPSPAIIQVASTQGGDEYTLIKETQVSGEKQHREYVSPTGEFVRSINAEWDNTTNLWTKDINGESASRVVQTHLGFDSNETQDTGTNSWADSGWVIPILPVERQVNISALTGTGVYSATTGFAISGGLDQLDMGLPLDIEASLEEIHITYNSSWNAVMAVNFLKDGVIGPSSVGFIHDSTKRTLALTSIGQLVSRGDFFNLQFKASAGAGSFNILQITTVQDLKGTSNLYPSL